MLKYPILDLSIANESKYAFFKCKKEPFKCKGSFLLFLCYSLNEIDRTIGMESVQRIVMQWITAGEKIRPSLPQMRREMFGQNRFALLLSREPIPPMDYGSAGIVDVPTFIWTNLARWMWACVTGPERCYSAETQGSTA